MCCTFTESEMSDTRLYVGEAERNGKTVHVCAYQNTAQTHGPNAMVLPIPTEMAMGPENLIDTREFKNFLKNIVDATQVHTKSAGMRRSMTLGSFGSDSLAQVIDVGSYTVVLAENVNQIPEALTRVPEDRRPSVSKKFLGGYGAIYPNQPIAICCWNGSIEAEPLLMWYEPKDRTTLFIPTMDAHDGNPPRLGERVYTDHIITVGSVGPTSGQKVVYTDRLIPEAVKDLLPTHAHGHRLPSWLENGDCFVKTAALHTSKKDLWEGSDPVVIERGFGGQTLYSSKMYGWH